MTEYDVESIMHYDGTLRGHFSKPIMTDKKTGKSIEVNKKMSKLDIEKLNKMYPCKSSDSMCTDSCLDACARTLMHGNVCGKFCKELFSSLFCYWVILEVDLTNLDSTSTQTLQKECKHLNVKLDYFTEGNQKLHAMYDKCMQKAKNLQNELDTCEKQSRTSDIEMIERLNGKITVLTSEVKLLQSDKESGKITF